MRKGTIRLLLILTLAFALCVFSAGCGERDKQSAANDPAAAATPEPVTELPSEETPAPGATDAPEAGGAATPAPPAEQAPAETAQDPAAAEQTPEPTPEASHEPITVELQYNGNPITAMSFMTSSVFQLDAVASDGSIGGTWTSSDASSASVDANGVVTCWKAGTPKITYTLNGASASCTLTITEPTVAIYFGGAPKNDITLNSIWGFTIQLVSVVNPLGSEVTWSSDDTSVASVSDNGFVTAHKMGTAVISCKCGTATAICYIRVTDNPPAYLAPTPDPNDGTPRIVITYAGVANSDFTMTVGQALDMDYALFNIDPATAQVTWSVLDPAYATVDANGVIVAKKSTWGIAPLRNYTVLKVTCGNYSYESYVFIKKEENTP